MTIIVFDLMVKRISTMASLMGTGGGTETFGWPGFKGNAVIEPCVKCGHTTNWWPLDDTAHRTPPEGPAATAKTVYQTAYRPGTWVEEDFESVDTSGGLVFAPSWTRNGITTTTNDDFYVVPGPFQGRYNTSPPTGGGGGQWIEFCGTNPSPDHTVPNVLNFSPAISAWGAYFVDIYEKTWLMHVRLTKSGGGTVDLVIPSSAWNYAFPPETYGFEDPPATSGSGNLAFWGFVSLDSYTQIEFLGGADYGTVFPNPPIDIWGMDGVMSVVRASLYDPVSTGSTVGAGTQADTLYTDLLTDTLYTVLGTDIVPVFAVGKRTSIWRSKKIVLRDHPSLAWLRLNGPMAGTAIVRIYGDDGALWHTATVATREPYRLPPGRNKHWEIEIESDAQFTSVALASSTEELL
jgi:hypothetical protein